MEPVRAANDGADDLRRALHAWTPLDWGLGYPLMAATVMALSAGLLDFRPWAAGFAYALLLLGVGSIWRAVLAPRATERVQAALGGAAVNLHEVPVFHAWHLAGRLRLVYLVPVMAVCAGLLGGTCADYSAYAALLLGVASIWCAVLPPRPLQRARAEEGRAVLNEDHGNHHEVASPESAIAWCGYVLVAAPVMGASFGLADTAAAALVSYALVLLGFAFLSVAMLPLRPMERILREEDRPVRNDNFVAPRARGMDWTGYFFVAAPVMASCAGLVDGLAAALFFYALHLLGVVFIIIAMLALAKQNMA